MPPMKTPAKFSSALRRPGSRLTLAGAWPAVALSVSHTVASAAAPATPDLTQLPPAVDREVSFSADIRPILEKSCVRCHGPERPKGGLRLDSREAALKGGESGAAILPGDSAKSPLIHDVARLVPDMEMPPTGKGDPLTPAEVGLLRKWIDQGAAWDVQPAEPRVEFSVTPTVQFISVSGNAARFREHYWNQEGWGGGASEFSLKYDLDPRTHVDIDGRALVGPDDYRFRTKVRRDDLGWVRLEYRESSRFYDDTGGYYEPFGTPAPRLGEDQVVRRRQATAEIGLEIPDWPKIRIAYDLRLRDGTESTLNWGSLTGNGLDRAIFPGRKRVDETTHQLTLDVSYDWNGLGIADFAQFEWHQQDNQRLSYDIQNPNFDFATLARDQQDYWRGANALRLERNLRDWLYVSGGYLYSRLDDDGGFRLQSFSPSDPTTPPSLDQSSDDITIRRQSHVINANTLIGPWEHLHFYAGLQAEWTRQEGFAAGQSFGQPTSYDANIDRAATDENFGVRYAGLPGTILWAETRFQQDSYSHFEEGLADAQQQFLRDTDADGSLAEYETGFSVAPWRPVNFQAKYRHRDRNNDYDHLRDVDLFSSGNGYPAFIRSRDTETDEIEARLVYQATRWLKTTLKYSSAATDYTTATAAWQDIGQVPPADYPASSIQSGEYDAQTVSAGFVLTPWQRLHLGTTVGWTTSRTRSGINNGAEVVPYKGDTWNLFNSLTYVLDEKTDLLATYLFSTADFTQDNADAGLPLGIAYTRHAATAGVSRRLKHDRTIRVEYGYFTYDEPTLGGAADYTAHALFASFRIPWR